MLALRPLRPRPQWARLVQTQRVARRLQSTSSDGWSPASSEAELPPPDTQGQRSMNYRPISTLTTEEREKRLRRFARGAIFIRPWDGVGTMPEAFAIIRGIERHFGRLRDFQLIRETDDPSMYKPYFWAEFEDDVDWQNFPLEPVVIQVRVPKVERHKPGGVSLYDLREHLLPADKVEGEDQFVRQSSLTKDDDESETFLVDVRIEKSDNLVYHKTMAEYHRMGRKSIVETGTSFAKWGGFYVPPPIAEDIESSEVSPTTQLSRMSKAVATWDRAIDAEEEKAKAKMRERRRASGTDSLSSRFDRSVSGDAFMKAAAEDVPSIPKAAPIEAEPLVAPLSAPVDPQSTAEPSPVSSLSDPVPAASSASLTPDPVTPAAPASLTHTQPPQLSGLSRKERILALARDNARNALPDGLVQPYLKEEERLEREKQEREAQEKERVTLRQKLWKLMGKKW